MLDKYLEIDRETLLTIVGLFGCIALIVSSVFLH